MYANWSTIEAAWSAVYHRDISDDLIRDRRSWRWFTVHLVGLAARDTPTATVLSTSTPTAVAWGPQAVGDQLAAWAN